MISEIRMSVISDIHLGHPKTPASHIIRNLNTYFLKNTLVRNSNIIIIAGDFWDRLRTMRDMDSIEILAWIGDLIKFCSHRNIILRVLNGTSSHDYAQSMHFIAQVKQIGLPINIRYVDTLSIEYIPELDVNVLYIPDEWRTDHTVIWREVKEALAEKQLTKVDFAVMHGLFDKQLPKHIQIPCHEADKYQSIVNSLIFIGHDHTHQIIDRIVVHGSFDRLAHGYESPKGFVYARVTPKRFTLSFIVNEGAMRYDTIDCRGLTIPEITDKLHGYIPSLPDDSAVRLQLSDSTKGIKTIGLDKLWPRIRWSAIVDRTTKPTSTTYKEIVTAKGISPAELLSIAETRLQTKTSDPLLISKALAILQQGIENVRL